MSALQPAPAVQPGRYLPAPPAPEPPQGEGRHPAEYLAILRRHRWFGVAGLLAIAVPALAFTLLQVPIYQAQTRLLIGQPSTTIPTLDKQSATSTRGEGMRADLQTVYDLLASRALAARVVRRLDLGNNREFMTPVPGPFSPARIKQLFSGKTASPVTPAAPPTDASAEGDVNPGAIDQLLGNLIVAPLVDSRLVDVKFESTNPALAAQIVNTVAEEFIRQDVELQSQATRQAAGWLEARLAEQRTKVEQSDLALQRFKEQQDALSVEDRQNIVVGQLTDINTALTRAKTERLAKEQVWNQVNASRRDREVLQSTPAVQQNTSVQALRGEVSTLQRERAQLAEKYGPKHPEMVRVTTALENARGRLDAELDKAVATVRAEYETALAQERSLASALEQQKREALSLNRKDLAYAALEREATSNRQVYEALQQQTKQTTLASELKESQIRIVDTAVVPGQPVRPDTARGVVFSLIGASLFAFGLVFAREFLDRRIETPADLTARLHLPCLGMIPTVDGQSSEAPLFDAASASPAFNEAIRRVRSHVWLGVVGPKTRSLLVTAAAPKDGKTTLAANLAASLAAAGERVLLIDADMRRPRLHELFGVAREPGLSSVLAGRTQLAPAIVATKAPQLSLLPAGPAAPNPSEMLGRGRFTLLLDSVAGQYSWVIVDSPPVLAVTDAAIMAPAVGGVLFVASAELTRGDAALEAVDQLRSTGAPMLGGVLNRVGLHQNPSYYSRYYSREYEKYYVRNE